MRIAFIITRLEEIGGAQVHVRDLSSALLTLGHEAVVLSGSGGVVAEQMRERGVSFHLLQRLRWPIQPWHDVQALWEMRQALRTINPDIVSTHTWKTGLLGRVAGFSLGIPTVYTAHGWGFTEGRELLQRGPFWLSDRLATPLSTRIITVCESDRLAAIRARIARPDKLVTVHNAMPDVDVALRADPASSPPGLLMVARFAKEKDHPTLFRALSGLLDLDWRLDLVGDGPLSNSAQALARSMGLGSRVRFLGQSHDVPERLAGSQVFVLTSTWEGFPRTILEAMRAGLPVVASDVGGVRESVVDGKTGYLVSRRDSSHLRDRLRALITHAELRVRMGAAGRARYEEKFTFTRLVRQTLAVYQAILSQGERHGQVRHS